jgi:hypothetical protein
VKTGAIFNNVVAEESNLKNIDQRRDWRNWNGRGWQFSEIIAVSPSRFLFREWCLLKIRKLKRIIHWANPQDALFEKLQNYKKLLDNGLILQGEYDVYKREVLSYM